VCDREKTVVDARLPLARRTALDMLARGMRRVGGGSWIGVDTVRSHTSGWQRRVVVGGLVLAAIFASPLIAVRVLRVSPAVLALTGVVLAFVWVVGRALRAAWVDRARAPLQLQIAEPPPRPPAKGVETLRGRARAVRTFESPVRGLPCVAARVVGETFGGIVDDSAATTFELVVDGDSEDDAYLVELGEAVVEARVVGEPREVEPSARLLAFLDRRGLFGEHGPVRVVEAVIAPGDHVEVSGVVAERTRDETYRTMGHVRYFRERPGAPLVIRKL
jgi:hypothetical protein